MTPHPPPPIPDHELLSSIGRGSYGQVWLARNRLGTLRAVKVVSRDAFEDRKPFEREFKGIQRFEPLSRSHDGLVDVLQVGGTDDHFYYVMELADDANAAGGIQNAESAGRKPASVPHSAPADTSSYTPRTLRAEQQRLGRLPVGGCVRIGRLLASALAHLHRHNLVHRDVKPSNIIFVEGQPKLADIGLVADLSEARSFVGTEGFIPPEGPGLPQADLYGLGKVLYEISTGRDRRDFPALPEEFGETPVQKSGAGSQKREARSHEPGSERSAFLELNAVIARACQADPGLRYPSAEAMEVDLALIEQGRSVRRNRTRQRRWAAARKAPLVMGLLVVAGLGLYWLSGRLGETGSVAANEQASIFVLPFSHPTPHLYRLESVTADNELCARITDALNDSLATIAGIRLGPLKSAWVFESGETLRRRVATVPYQMRYTVQGRLETTNAALKGSVELHDLQQARVLWSTTIVAATNDVIGIEKRILSALLSTLRINVNPETQARMDGILNNNWAAYAKYREAQRHFHQWLMPSLTLAMEAYHQALALDPGYVDARLGVVSVRRRFAAFAEPPRRVWPDIRSDLRAILKIDDTCFGARGWLASLQISHDYNWQDGMAIYQELIQLNPADHLAWAIYYRFLGRKAAAQVEQAQAEQDYPLDYLVLDHGCAARYAAHEFGDCLRRARHAQTVRPEHRGGFNYWVARASIELGDYQVALEAIRLYRQVESVTESLALEGRIYALMGEPEKAREILGQLQREISYVSPYHVAWIHAALRDKDAALSSLERAYEDRSEHLVNTELGGLRTDPAWDNLREDPRFEALCQKVGLGKGEWPK